MGTSGIIYKENVSIKKKKKSDFVYTYRQSNRFPCRVRISSILSYCVCTHSVTKIKSSSHKNADFDSKCKQGLTVG